MIDCYHWPAVMSFEQKHEPQQQHELQLLCVLQLLYELQQIHGLQQLRVVQMLCEPQQMHGLQLQHVLQQLDEPQLPWQMLLSVLQLWLQQLPSVLLDELNRLLQKILKLTGLIQMN